MSTSHIYRFIVGDIILENFETKVILYSNIFGASGSEKESYTPLTEPRTSPYLVEQFWKISSYLPELFQQITSSSQEVIWERREGGARSYFYLILAVLPKVKFIRIKGE